MNKRIRNGNRETHGRYLIHKTLFDGQILTSPTIFKITVVIFVTFGEIGLAFSVYNISKNYLTIEDTWVDIYKISQSEFVSSSVSHLNVPLILESI